MAGSGAVDCGCAHDKHITCLLRHSRQCHSQGRTRRARFRINTTQLNIRFVPDQHADDIVAKVRAHLLSEFAKRKSENTVRTMSRSHKYLEVIVRR